jgi:hypothetical protein
MFARVVLVQATPDRIEGALTYYRSNVLPQVQQLDGFKRAVALVDREGGKALTMAFFDDEKALAASEEVAARIRSEAAQTIGAQPELLGSFEVVIDEKA